MPRRTTTSSASMESSEAETYDVVGASAGLHDARGAMRSPRVWQRSRSLAARMRAPSRMVTRSPCSFISLTTSRAAAIVVSVHLLEFVGEEAGGGVGFGGERGLQTGRQRSRELSVQKDAEEDEQQREERQVERGQARAEAAGLIGIARPPGLAVRM